MFVQHAAEFEFDSPTENQLIDITQRVENALRKSHVQTGQALVFTLSSTSAITTVEFEPGLRRDVPAALERLVPRDLPYGHEETWHDGNGHSHVRATLLKPDLLVPIQGGRLRLGQWQQIVFAEFDNKPRRRTVVVHAWGQSGLTDA